MVRGKGREGMRMNDFKRFEDTLNEINEECEREMPGILDGLRDKIKPTARMVLLTMPEIIWKNIELEAEINGRPLEELLNPVIFEAVLRKLVSKQRFIKLLEKLLDEGRKNDG